MRKKGQIYLLAALILGLIIFLLVAETNIVKETVIDDDFENLAKNYEIESAKFMNQLLESGSADMINKFLRFTIVFSSYAKTKNPEFGVIYAFMYNGQVHIGNYLDRPMKVRDAPPGREQLPGCYQQLRTNVVVGGLRMDISGVSTGAFTNCLLSMPAPPVNRLKFLIENVEYEVELEPSRPEIIIVSREEIANQRKVYVKGNFKKGRNN